MTDVSLPGWAGELRERYLRGEASLFVLHGNVNDVVLHEGKLLGLQDFLCKVLLPQTKDVVVRYDVSSGVELLKDKGRAGLGEIALEREATKVLPGLERILITQDKVAVVIGYAEMLAPNGDPNFFSEADRQSVVTFHRWSMSPLIARADNLVVLVTENVAELNQKLVSNPKTGLVRVPLPDEAERRAVISQLVPDVEPAWLARLVEVTSALRNVQLQTILAPATDDDPDERRHYIEGLLGPGSEARAQKLAALTKGLPREEIKALVAPGADASASLAESERAARDRVVDAIFKRKREIIERECFGLVEFIQSRHDFSVVGGMEEVKKELAQIARYVREGQRERCPMGLLFTGPMGTGKTFVAEAFVKESGLTGVMLKNFRSKWVGATEANLERILTVIAAMGQVLVVIDEGDRAFGGGEGESDWGTGSRVIARIKEFMSDTENRGRVMFVLMTNRPDKLDVDLKRAGRLDRKIPFLYPQEATEVEGVLMAQLRKHKLQGALEFPRDRALSEKLVGYSNAEIEGVVLLANEDGQGPGSTLINAERLAAAIRDYLPSRDLEMLEYMELIAVFEASNRKFLPKKFAAMRADELQARLELLRTRVGGRR